MIGDPQQQNPLAGLMSLLGQSSAGPQAAPPPMPAPTQQPPAVPPGGAAPPQAASAPPMQQPQSQMGPMIQSLMGQSQQAMNNPMGQAVPQGGGLIDALKHPLVAGIIKALAGAAQSYGWTAMQPQEREERTQMQQQKAEALGKLAETGAQYENTAAWRQAQLGIGQENADTRRMNEQSQDQARQVAEEVNKGKLEVQTELAKSTEDYRAGRLDQGNARIAQLQQKIGIQAKQFEEALKVRSAIVGIDRAKLELGQQANDIRQQLVDVAKLGLAQKGTEQGAQIISKLQQFKTEHYIMSNFTDMSDLDQLISSAGSSGMPGVATVAPSVQPTPTGVPQPGPANKVEAKKHQQSSGGGSGVTHVYVPGQGIQPVGGK